MAIHPLGPGPGVHTERRLFPRRVANSVFPQTPVSTEEESGEEDEEGKLRREPPLSGKPPEGLQHRRYPAPGTGAVPLPRGRSGRRDGFGFKTTPSACCSPSSSPPEPRPASSFDNVHSRRSQIDSCWFDFQDMFVDPDCRGAYYWMALVSLAVVYNWIVIILRVAFEDHPDTHPLSPNVFRFLDILCDVIYLSDVAVQSRMAYLEDGCLVRDLRQTVRHYRSQPRFVLDALSVIPVSTVFGIASVFLPFLPISANLKDMYSPVLRFLRLLKYHSMKRFFEKTDSRTNNPNLVRAFKLSLHLWLVIHWIGCFYYLLSKYEGLGSNDWVYPSGEENSSFQRKYVLCVFWSTMTLTTIGERPSPVTEIEYVFTGVTFLIGVFVFAAVVGNVGDVISNMNAARHDFQGRMDQIKFYLAHRNVPEHLQDRIKRWAEYTWTRTKAIDEQSMLQLLPSRLRTEVAIYVHLGTLKKVRIFEQCEEGLLRELVLKLRPSIYSPGEYICRIGEIGREMYIIDHGRVEILFPDQATGQTKQVAVMTPGNYFGEISLLKLDDGQNKRTADVRSIGFSELLCLSRRDLMSALMEYPEAKKILEEHARQRMQQTKRAPTSDSTETAPSPPTASSRRSARAVFAEVMRQEGFSKLLSGKASEELMEMKQILKELKEIRNQLSNNGVKQLAEHCSVLKKQLLEKDQELQETRSELLVQRQAILLSASRARTEASSTTCASSTGDTGDKERERRKQDSASLSGSLSSPDTTRRPRVRQRSRFKSARSDASDETSSPDKGSPTLSSTGSPTLSPTLSPSLSPSLSLSPASASPYSVCTVKSLPSTDSPPLQKPRRRRSPPVLNRLPSPRRQGFDQQQGELVGGNKRCQQHSLSAAGLPGVGAAFGGGGGDDALLLLGKSHEDVEVGNSPACDVSTGYRPSEDSVDSWTTEDQRQRDEQSSAEDAEVAATPARSPDTAFCSSMSSTVGSRSSFEIVSPTTVASRQARRRRHYSINDPLDVELEDSPIFTSSDDLRCAASVSTSSSQCTCTTDDNSSQATSTSSNRSGRRPPRPRRKTNEGEERSSSGGPVPVPVVRPRERDRPPSSSSSPPRTPSPSPSSTTSPSPSPSASAPPSLEKRLSHEEPHDPSVDTDRESAKGPGEGSVGSMCSVGFSPPSVHSGSSPTRISSPDSLLSQRLNEQFKKELLVKGDGLCDMDLQKSAHKVYEVSEEGEGDCSSFQNRRPARSCRDEETTKRASPSPSEEADGQCTHSESRKVPSPQILLEDGDVTDGLDGNVSRECPGSKERTQPSPQSVSLDDGDATDGLKVSGKRGELLGKTDEAFSSPQNVSPTDGDITDGLDGNLSHSLGQFPGPKECEVNVKEEDDSLPDGDVAVHYLVPAMRLTSTFSKKARKPESESPKVVTCKKIDDNELSILLARRREASSTIESDISSTVLSHVGDSSQTVCVTAGGSVTISPSEPREQGRVGAQLSKAEPAHSSYNVAPYSANSSDDSHQTPKKPLASVRENVCSGSSVGLLSNRTRGAYSRVEFSHKPTLERGGCSEYPYPWKEPTMAASTDSELATKTSEKTSVSEFRQSNHPVVISYVDSGTDDARTFPECSPERSPLVLMPKTSSVQTVTLSKSARDSRKCDKSRSDDGTAASEANDSASAKQQRQEESVSGDVAGDSTPVSPEAFVFRPQTPKEPGDPGDQESSSPPPAAGKSPTLKRRRGRHRDTILEISMFPFSRKEKMPTSPPQEDSPSVSPTETAEAEGSDKSPDMSPNFENDASLARVRRRYSAARYRWKSVESQRETQKASGAAPETRCLDSVSRNPSQICHSEKLAPLVTMFDDQQGMKSPERTSVTDEQVDSCAFPRESSMSPPAPDGCQTPSPERCVPSPGPGDAVGAVNERDACDADADVCETREKMASDSSSKDASSPAKRKVLRRRSLSKRLSNPVGKELRREKTDLSAKHSQSNTGARADSPGSGEDGQADGVALRDRFSSRVVATDSTEYPLSLVKTLPRQQSPEAVLRTVPVSPAAGSASAPRGDHREQDDGTEETRTFLIQQFDPLQGVRVVQVATAGSSQLDASSELSSTPSRGSLYKGQGPRKGEVKKGSSRLLPPGAQASPLDAPFRQEEVRDVAECEADCHPLTFKDRLLAAARRIGSQSTESDSSSLSPSPVSSGSNPHQGAGLAGGTKNYSYKSTEPKSHSSCFCSDSSHGAGVSRCDSSCTPGNCSALTSSQASSLAALSSSANSISEDSRPAVGGKRQFKQHYSGMKANGNQSTSNNSRKQRELWERSGDSDQSMDESFIERVVGSTMAEALHLHSKKLLDLDPGVLGPGEGSSGLALADFEVEDEDEALSDMSGCLDHSDLNSDLDDL